jgi:hypothetical protein
MNNAPKPIDVSILSKVDKAWVSSQKPKPGDNKSGLAIIAAGLISQCNFLESNNSIPLQME